MPASRSVFLGLINVISFRDCIYLLQDTRYKKLYLKSAFNINISNISH